ncbi:MAG: LemA family protein [Bacteroidia bacterium]|nr:LemA family protein [Bacteroidia bacterium]
MQRILWIVLILLVVGGGCAYMGGTSTYNQMVVQRESVDAQWAQVENQYQRRADLIPNIVESVKGYQNFEQGVLVGVAEARAKVGQLTVSKEVLENPALLDQFNKTQGEFGQAIQRLMSVTENYPDLQANTNYMALIKELEGTENRISVERKKFNESAQAYNTLIKQFPKNIYANVFGFDEVAYFKATPGNETAPKVNFN